MCKVRDRDVPGVLEEQQGGLYGWSRGSSLRLTVLLGSIPFRDGANPSRGKVANNSPFFVPSTIWFT